VEEIRVREEAIERVRIQAENMAKYSKEVSQEANEQLLVAIARAERAEQEAVERIREAEERVNLQAEIIAKRSEERSREANEQLLAAIARAERAEQQSAEKISEAEERIQKAVESAAQLEQKFMDAMKQMKGSAGMRQSLKLKLDKKLTCISERIDMDADNDADAQRNWVRWRSTVEDKVPDPEDEAVENLLRPRTEIVEFPNLMGQRNVDREQSMADSEANIPDSTDDDNETSMRSEDRGFTAEQQGKQTTMV